MDSKQPNLQVLLLDAWHAVVADDQRTTHTAAVACNLHTVMLQVDGNKLADAATAPHLTECTHKMLGTAVHAQDVAVEEDEGAAPA